MSNSIHCLHFHRVVCALCDKTLDFSSDLKRDDAHQTEIHIKHRHTRPGHALNHDCPGIHRVVIQRRIIGKHHITSRTGLSEVVRREFNTRTITVLTKCLCGSAVLSDIILLDEDTKTGCDTYIIDTATSGHENHGGFLTTFRRDCE